MRRSHPKHWFGRLAPADAARLIVALERVRQNDWIRWAQSPDRRLSFGEPGDPAAAALVTLNRQVSAAIFRRLRSDRTCQTCVLRAAAQALLDDDLELSKGLLRRLVDATIGFEALANLTELHPKSLIRMLSPNGNPAASHVVAVVARLAQWQGVRLTVA